MYERMQGELTCHHVLSVQKTLQINEMHFIADIATQYFIDNAFSINSTMREPVPPVTEKSLLMICIPGCPLP